MQLEKLKNKKILVFKKYSNENEIIQISKDVLEIQFCNDFANALTLDLKNYDHLICDYSLGDQDFVTFIQEAKALALNDDFLIKYSSFEQKKENNKESQTNRIDHDISQTEIDSLVGSFMDFDLPEVTLKESLSLSENNDFDISKVGIFLIDEMSIVFSSRLENIPDVINLKIGDYEFLVDKGIHKTEANDEDQDDKHFFEISNDGITDNILIEFLKNKIKSERAFNNLISFT